MKNNYSKYVTVGLVFLLMFVFVSCGGESNHDEDANNQNISERVDNVDDYVSPISMSDLPELDYFELPKVTSTTAELALGYIPRSLNRDVSKFGFNMLSFTNIKHGLERFEYHSSSPSELDLILATMYAPEFLLGRVFDQRQPIDDPKNWSWMVHDRVTDGTWFAGNLSMGDKLLPAMADDNYSSEPLINSSMTSFFADWSNKSPIYGRHVAPYSPEFGYFSPQKLNTEQADQTGVLIRQKLVGFAGEDEIVDIIPFIGDAENAVLIKSKLSLENAVSNLGISAVITNEELSAIEDLKGFGRHIGLDWIAFSHHPNETHPVRIILRYSSNQIAENDMKLLKYIHENGLSKVKQNREISADLIMVNQKRFSVYQNIGVIECDILDSSPAHSPDDPAMMADIRAADKLADLFLNGLMPELFLNK